MNITEIQAAKVYLAKSGIEGTKILTPVVANKIVTSVNMKNGAYTVAASPVTPALLSVTVSTVATADTMGTLTIVGTDIDGAALTEVVTPVSGSTVYTTHEFKTVTGVTGADWAAGSTADTIIVGTFGITAPTGYYFSSLIVMSAAVVNSMTRLTGTHAPLESLSTIPAGTYPIKASAIALTSGQAIVTLARL